MSCILRIESLSVSTLFVPKQHIALLKPLSKRFTISKIPSTRITLPFIGFTQDYSEAVEFQNEDYDPKEDTVSSLSEECGYFTVKDLPDVSEEL